MKVDVFRSNRHFVILDYFMSHGQLLLRSGIDKNNKTNLDIIFFGVSYIQLPTSFLGITIKKSYKQHIIPEYESIKLFLSYDGSFLFEIECKSELFYVGASNFIVYENDLRFNETSLGVLDYIGREKELMRCF